MGVIGKGTNSFRKQDVAEQKTVALGFKKIRFAHKATLGDTTINLASLVTPTEMSANGFTNPNATAIARAQIMLFRNNLKLVSSLRGLLVDQLSYNVSSNSTITFLDFTAEDGEIFQGWLDEAATTSINAVDGKTIVASGILLAGQTDFNIGTPIPLNQNPAQQIGAVLAFADRGLQYRKVGNLTTGDGDYIEVPVAGGLGTLLRFNASASDRFITVVSNGVVSERPDGSMMAFLERVQGQIDAMVPTLAAVAGVPTTTFQTAPNDIDLKQFGDTVTSLAATQIVDEARITALENGYRNMIVLTGLSGYGSTATTVHRWSTILKQTGSGLVYNNSLVTGTTVTITQAGMYSISAFSGQKVVNASYIGLTLNASVAEQSTASYSLSWPTLLMLTGSNTATVGTNLTYTDYFPAGSILRIQNDTAFVGPDVPSNARWQITQVGN